VRRAPYAVGEIGTRGELAWILRERGWCGNLGGSTRADFWGAHLRTADLHGADLERVSRLV